MNDGTAVADAVGEGLGEMTQPEEVDAEHGDGVERARDSGNVAQRADVVVDRRHGLIDRGGGGKIDDHVLGGVRDQLVGQWGAVERDDVSAAGREQSQRRGADARRRAGQHDALTRHVDDGCVHGDLPETCWPLRSAIVPHRGAVGRNRRAGQPALSTCGETRRHPSKYGNGSQIVSRGMVSCPRPGALTTTVPVTVVAGGPEASAVIRSLTTSPGVAAVAPAGMLTWRDRPTLAVTMADVAERRPGCGCCRIRLDLVDGLVRLVRRRVPPAAVVVGLDEDDDPATALRTILSDPDLARLVHVDRLLVSVDAVSLATRLAAGLPFGDQLLFDRLAMADRVFVARSRRLTDEAHERLGAVLRSRARFGPVQEMAAATRVSGLSAWHGCPNVEPSAEAPPFDPGDAELPEMVVLEQAGVLDPDGVDDWLDGLLSRHGRSTLRVQGVLAVAGMPWRVCCHAVRSFAASHPEHEHATHRPANRSFVAVAGTGLDADELATSLEATRTR